jgi:signal recognition particle subunit SRP54
MFDALSTRLQDAFRSIRGETRLTETTVEHVLRDIRLALLEADVNVNVVKAFVARVRDRALDQAVLKSLTPGQQVVKVVRDELLALFGDAEGGLQETAARPRVILMLGLQGSGKTTTTGKLAKWLAKQGRYPIVVSTDVRRPAAIEQLAIVAKQAGVRVHEPAGSLDPVGRATSAIAVARAVGNDVVIVDTAGRLHIDDELMQELVAIKAAANPADLLYAADAMTGQDAVRSAGEFNRQVGVTGVVLTKIDGDARGGAALSVVSVVGVPIAFVGSGERIDDLEPFHADRFVSRLLGMGDVLSLIERAEEVVDAGDATRLEQKIRKGGFTLEDFRDQLRMLRRMGPLDKVLGMLPGMGAMKELAAQKPDERQLRRTEAIINSMTPNERRRADLDGSRRRRVARGSGTTVEDVNRLLKQFSDMQRMLQMVGRMTGEPIAAPPKKKKKSPFSLMR